LLEIDNRRKTQWSELSVLITIKNTSKVLDLCEQLKEKFAVIPTVVNLTASSVKFVPVLAFVLDEVEEICLEDSL
jgi:hypothetical protein